MNRFQGPYQAGRGQKVPPVRGGGTLSAPMGAPKRMRFPFRMPLKSYAKFFERAGGPYARLMRIDPNKTVKTSRMLDSYLQQYLPEWYDKPHWYNYEGWKGPGYQLAPYPPDFYPYPPPTEPGNIFFWCSTGSQNFNAVGYSTGPFSGTPCIDTEIWIPSGPIGTKIPAGVNEVIFGRFSGDMQRMTKNRCYGFHGPSDRPWNPIPRIVSPLTRVGTIELEGDGGFPDPADWVQPEDPVGPVGRIGPRVSGGQLRPYQRPATQYQLRPGDSGFGPPATVGHNQLPPGPGRKEKKFDLGGNERTLRKALANAHGKFSEGGEAMNDIAKAIKGHPCKGLAPGEMAACILANSGKIDWNQALQNLLADQLQDRVIGGLNKAAAKNFNRAGYSRPFGRGFSGPSRYAQFNRFR